MARRTLSKQMQWRSARVSVLIASPKKNILPPEMIVVELRPGDYLQERFGKDPCKLKELFETTQRTLQRTDPSWVFRARQVECRVLLVEAEVTQELHLMPWLLSFHPEHSQKGKSKM